MGDQKRWFKVWTSITSDDDFDPSRAGGLLSLGRFAILGAYTALHGERGVVEIMPDTLFRLLNVTDLVTARGELAFKNVLFEEGKNRHGKITVTWCKWVKYQEDSTQAERAKASRIKKRGEEKRGEEKRGEDILSSSCAEPSGFARAEQGQNGQHLAVRKKNSQISEQALTLATKLKDSILINTLGTTAPTLSALRQWAGDIDKLNRLDGKSWEQIEWLLAWSQKDQFWSTNIQSGAKFRKQWNQLLAKASKEQPKHGAPLTTEELMEEDDFARLTREELEKIALAKEKKHGPRTF